MVFSKFDHFFLVKWWFLIIVFIFIILHFSLNLTDLAFSSKLYRLKKKCRRSKLKSGQR